MPKSKEWFAEHPRISAYVSQELKNRLSEYMSANGYWSVSDALTAILEQHLGLTTSAKTEDANAISEEPVVASLLHSLQSQVSELQQALHKVQESSNFISNLNQRVSSLEESSHSSSSSLISSLTERLNILEAQVRSISLTSSSNVTALEVSTAVRQDSSLNLIPIISPVEESNVNSGFSYKLPVKVDLAAPEPEPAAHVIERKNTSFSSENPQDGNNDLTALELAKLLGVGERAVSIAAVKGHEYFRDWSAKKGKGIFDFEAVHSNDQKPKRRFYLHSGSKPTSVSRLS